MNQPKNLHHHSLPIVVLAVAAFVLSVPLVINRSNQSLSSAYNQAAGRLTTSLVSIKAGQNDSASIHFKKVKVQDPATAPKVNEFSSLGVQTDLQLAVIQATKTLE